MDKPSASKNAKQCNCSKHYTQKGNNLTGQPEGRFFPLCLHLFGKGCHKGNRQGAFCKEITKEIWYTEGSHKGCKFFACAEDCTKHYLSDKAQDSRPHNREHDFFCGFCCASLAHAFISL